MHDTYHEYIYDVLQTFKDYGTKGISEITYKDAVKVTTHIEDLFDHPEKETWKSKDGWFKSW
jgi:hypothetical protein